MKEALKVYGLGLLLMLAFGFGWEYLQPKPKLPEFAPDFALVDLDGNTHRLESYRGQRVVINFWASWCGPCQMLTPILEEAVNACGGKVDKETVGWWM